ncbi:gdsl esterase/lipase [Quercus suber]|uniref:Gdsl esterase/lipase n=1 Tax=Quercus suber TaxID=58331 RepID=A0AAW0M520_QUESU
MLDSLLCKLSSEFEGTEYSLGNAYEITYNVIENPLPFSEQFTLGKINAKSICDSKANLCLNHKDHLFWDLFHPTHAASELPANTIYHGPPRFAFPISFSQLAYDNLKCITKYSLVSARA